MAGAIRIKCPLKMSLINSKKALFSRKAHVSLKIRSTKGNCQEAADHQFEGSCSYTVIVKELPVQRELIL